ncbi:TraB/GumN family protein [Aliiroseovarius sp. KMU-50]|uniref:TraB/GumN family protein n=1 Tax=Aliiroseovarius salicola TaxID=3009082 RepID=A0ABT4W3U1_9RHOB|nr:TraB/GumN family protein [Aliiroseovarius sp. KMU-50]MDA5095191.1 TraB/GumN family protein [Aliiroseovarius sp. KMU-50]
MQRLFSLALATLFALNGAAYALCTGANALDSLPASTRVAIQDRVDGIPYSEGLLWLAEKDQRSLVLIGTIHVPDPRLDTLLAQLQPHLASADKLFLELTSEEEQLFQSMMQRDPAKFLIMSGPGLDERLSPEAWSKLTDTLADLPHLGLPPEAASRLQPWFLGLLLAMPPCMFDSLAQGKLGLDRRIEKAAAQLDLPAGGLDDPQSLMDMFSDHPLDEQIEDMEAGIMLMDHDPSSIVALVESYFDGNFQIGWEVSLQQGRDVAAKTGRTAWLDAEIAEMEYQMLTVRNQLWLEELTQENQPARAVIAVGAAHMPGESGLLNLLAQDGWNISSIALDLP